MMLIGALFRSGKQRTKSFLRPLQAFVGQNNRFCLVDRILDQTLFVQSVESIPVIAFPCPPLIMQRQQQQAQNGIVNALSVDLHVINHSSQCSRERA